MAAHQHVKLVLQPGRGKLASALFGAGLAALCGVGVALEGRLTGWLIVAGALSAAAICWRAFHSPRWDLRLNQSGLAFGTLTGRRALSWCDVQSFRVVGFGSNRLVALTCAPGLGGGRLQTMRRRLSGFDHLLTETYGLSAPELAGLLESWRARYGKRSINPVIVPAPAVAACV